MKNVLIIKVRLELVGPLLNLTAKKNYTQILGVCKYWSNEYFVVLVGHAESSSAQVSR